METDQIAAEVRGCQRCPPGQWTDNAVPGEGPADAEIMFIGEGPGFHEDRQGRPFVGKSGQLLEPVTHQRRATRCSLPTSSSAVRPKIAFAAGRVSRLARPSRPPGSRHQTEDHRDAGPSFPCNAISPVNRSPASMARKPNLRGNTACVAMFHPAAALRNPQWMTEIRNDLCPVARCSTRCANTATPSAPSVVPPAALPPDDF